MKTTLHHGKSVSSFLSHHPLCFVVSKYPHYYSTILLGDASNPEVRVLRGLPSVGREVRAAEGGGAGPLVFRPGDIFQIENGVLGGV